MIRKITSLPENIGFRSWSISTTMYGKSMENYNDQDSARLSIPELATVIAQQVKLTDIVNGRAYVVEFITGDVYINNVEIEPGDGYLQLCSLNPKHPDLSFHIDQVEHVYEVYRVLINKDESDNL